VAYVRKNPPKVIDFFCGAGGFSEGFRQQGFKIVMGIDNWRPAIESHNLNHGLADSVRDMLEFESLAEIEKLPDTEVLVGSPPCVLFSMSNNAGKSDKTLGIRLIESYLRIIAVKKHKKGSRLEAWFLENVPNSRKYVKAEYTFANLGLGEWAKAQGKSPDCVALDIAGNSDVLNAADYGAPQKRQRFVCGEIRAAGGFVHPRKTHMAYVKLKDIRNILPKPNSPKNRKQWRDPNYPGLSLPMEQITDHFYDTGIYEVQWRNARDYKVNHAYMGRMSFPEDENNPSRTVMATRSSSSRESLIYKSEYKRKGDGEYRSPTIREIACLMGFPIAYQFTGGESTKWAQIGNAVPTHLSAALAKIVRESLGMRPLRPTEISFEGVLKNHDKVPNLNTFSKKVFDSPPKRKVLSCFRKHPFKDGNMTVALTNYNPIKKPDEAENVWYSSVFYGTGKGFSLEVLKPGAHEYLESLILESAGPLGRQFIKDFNSRFEISIRGAWCFQGAYENPQQFDFELNPTVLVDLLAEFISEYNVDTKTRVNSARTIAGRTALPVRQVMAMYAINRLVS
jgi:DNA (cytosine-5)-methyltransferase 1